MPERNILKPSLCVRAHHAGQAADLLAGHRVALVRHGRRAFLFLAEKLLGLADFGTLQMADLRRDLVQRARDYCERCQIVSVTVTLDDLGRYGGGLQSQAGTNLFFEFRAEVSERSYRTGKLAYAHVLGGSPEAFN